MHCSFSLYSNISWKILNYLQDIRDLEYYLSPLLNQNCRCTHQAWDLSGHVMSGWLFTDLTSALQQTYKPCRHSFIFYFWAKYSSKIYSVLNPAIMGDVLLLPKTKSVKWACSQDHMSMLKQSSIMPFPFHSSQWARRCHNSWEELLVTVAVTKNSVKGNWKEKGFILFHVLFQKQEKTQGQKREAAGHSYSIVKKWRIRNACAQLNLSVLCHPWCGAQAMIPQKTNWASSHYWMTLTPRQAQTPVFQVNLYSVKLTIDTSHHIC